jgi:carboxymethylenebutenolidase
MKVNKLLGIIVFTILSSHSFAEEPDVAKKRLDASPRHHEWVDIKTKAGRTVRAFLVYPEASKPVPAVLVIHENKGLTDWVRSVVDQLAEAGYVALAPDLLSQTGPDKGGTDSFGSVEAATKGIYKLPQDQVVGDLDACAEYLHKLDAVNKKIAVAGFCWGGGQTFRYATHNPDLMGAFVFYGPAPAEPEELKNIKAPVYGFYGGNDFRISGEVPKTKEAMAKLKKPYDAVIYEKAGHGFMRSGEGPQAEPPNSKAMKEAWDRWKKLLKELNSAHAESKSS